MTTWFSHPVEWQSSMTLRTQSDNSMSVLIDKGPIKMKALFDGFVIFRKTSVDPAPAIGNLEFVLTPGNWSDEMQKFFNPSRNNEKGIESAFSELPPGRVVYRQIARADIETKLHELIFTRFDEWRGDNSKTHRSLYYILNPLPSMGLLKDVLLAAWNKGVTDDERKKLVDDEIKKALDRVFNTGFSNLVGDSLPVQGGDVLATTGTAGLPAELVFEIRNFYGEPINPHFYLRKLEKSLGDLTPRPPFKADDDQVARIKTTGEPLSIRLPRQSGSVFTLLEGASGRTPYQSQLIWTHTLDESDKDYPTKVEARPGQSPSVPTVDTTAEQRVNDMWDNDNVAINKYAEFFSCPCELILATIKKEAAQWSDDLLGDKHSIRFEKIPETADYATDHEDLRKAGSPLTASCLQAYWNLAGGCHTNIDKSFYETADKLVETKNLPKLELTDLVESTAKIGTEANRKLISWAQIQKIETVKASLIARTDMVLPALGRNSSGVTHYELIKTQVSEDAAKKYFAKVGGIGAVGDTPKPPTPFTLNNYPLPLKTKGDEMVVDSTIKWKDLLSILKVLRANGVSNVPKATYTLQPLEKDTGVDIHDKYTIGQLMKFIPTTDRTVAKAVVDDYIQMMEKSLRFIDNPTKPEDAQIKQVGTTTFLTLKETKAMSKIYPHRISIGVGQILLDTGIRKVIGFVKKHYPSLFADLGVPVPDDKINARLTWLWTNLWENRDLQIAFIAAYHKQNATVHWQAINAENSNKVLYRVGERMTMFDFPKSGACYNAGSVRKPEDGKPDTPWGLATFGAYERDFWSAIAAAAKRFNTFSSPDPKWAKVRLRPDLETDTGMDAR